MHTRMKRARVARLAIAVASVVLLGACGSSSTGPSNANVSGSYTLSSVGGSSLPYTIPNTSQPEIVQSATITLTSDSTYSATATGTVSGSPSTLSRMPDTTA